MFDFESTLDAPRPKSKFCVVYDQRSGAVVHMHQFIGDDTGMWGPDGKDTRERMALETAKQNSEAEHHRVMHAPANFRYKPDALYRVDLKSGKLKTVPGSGPSGRESVTRKGKTP